MSFGDSLSCEGTLFRSPIANGYFLRPVINSFLLHTHVHSPLARALYTTLSNVRVNDKFQDSMYLFLEMVRAGVMHGNLWSNRAYSGGPSFGDGRSPFQASI